MRERYADGVRNEDERVEERGRLALLDPYVRRAVHAAGAVGHGFLRQLPAQPGGPDLRCDAPASGDDVSGYRVGTGHPYTLA